MAEPRQAEQSDLKFNQGDGEARSWLPWIIAGLAVVLGAGLLAVLGGHRSTTVDVGPGLAPIDPYGAKLRVTNVHMSEASNFAGGKVTYLDGQITNQGDKTINGVTVQVAFHNELKEIAQKETLPLNLIRTHEPYVDTEPVSASPLKPGEPREFRLIFDSVTADWNQQYPEIRVIHVQSAQIPK